jgi:hypothetical protein
MNKYACQPARLRDPWYWDPRYWAGLLLICLALAACGGDEAVTPTPSAEATQAIAVPAVSAGSPLGAPLSTPVPATEASAATVDASASPTATVDSAGGATVFAPLEVEEGAGCAIESNLDLLGFPDLEERMGCAVAEASMEPVAINEYGAAQPTDRFMLWFGEENTIYVLFPEGQYKTYADTWNEATDPTYTCNPLNWEEDSPPLPRRGFGKVWCSDPVVRETLGPVAREERLCQHTVMQRFANGRLLACFEDATVRYFRLRDDGTWDLELQ